MPASPPQVAPADMKLEVGMAAMDSSEDELDRIGKRSTFTCPECRGTLWEMNEEGALRFRGLVSHAYTVETVVAEQSRRLEDALWVDVERRVVSRAETGRERADERRAVRERMDATIEYSA